MAMPQNSHSILMAPIISNGGSPARESFRRFFECWLVEQNQQLQELISASSSVAFANSNHPDADAILQPLIDRVVRHYEHYYQAKSRCAEQDVLSMFSPSWRSSLEDAFLWIGGWRPSMAFHLLYSKSGHQLEAQLAELIRGLSTGDLADLSPDQLSRVDKLHQRTITEEKKISEKLGKHQETVADSSTVELSHVMSDMLQNRDVPGNRSLDNIEEQIENTLVSKEEGLQKILKKADELRLRTLKDILNILGLTQAVHFLIAAAELHLRFHDWGKKRDDEVPFQ
ncbi:hypothetical protein CDL15_Pgr013872 [Punica granatum]|nr:hypothetical protein CDL15_Pgr013872 [Punica granatum]PKI72662.1 hypothetical protein CRG98_007039 [Punica granatum]